MLWFLPVYFIWIKSKTESYHWFFPLIGLSRPTLNCKIGRRNFWLNRHVSSICRSIFSTIVSPACLARFAAFYSPISSRATRYFRPTCVPHTQHGGRNIGIVVAQREVYLFSRAREKYAYLYGDKCEKKRDVSFRKSRTKRNVGPRNSSRRRFIFIALETQTSFMLALLHAFSTFNSDFGTFASQLFVHGSFRFDDAFTGFTPVLRVSYIHNI